MDENQVNSTNKQQNESAPEKKKDLFGEIFSFRNVFIFAILLGILIVFWYLQT